MLRALIVRDFVELEPYAPAWRRLNQRAVASSPIASPTWISAWWRGFGAADGRRLCSVLFFDGDELVGMAPLSLRTVRARDLLPVRRLELLCTGEPEAEEICSEYLGVSTASSHESSIADELARLLSEELLGGWDELRMSAMNGEDPFVATLAGSLRAARLEAAVQSSGTCFSIRLP